MIGRFGAITILLLCCLYAIGDEAARVNLAPNPTFADRELGLIGWYPLGVNPQPETCLTIAENEGRNDAYSLHVKIGPAGIVSGTECYSSYNAGEGVRQVTGENGVRGVRTIAYRLDRDVRTFHASVWIRAKHEEDIALQVRWFTRVGRRQPVVFLHQDETKTPIANEGGWRKYELSAIRPLEAHQAQLAIETAGLDSIAIDDVTVELLRAPNILLLVDQVGYEPDSTTKIALLQTNTEIKVNDSDPFRVVRLEDGKNVFEGFWKKLGYHATFDRYYYQGDFSNIQNPGHYVVEITFEAETITSEPFEIGEHLYVERAFNSAYEFFYYQRCGTEVPGFHPACHTDDALMPDGSTKDLSGAWHDAGDYNKYNGFTPESMLALILAYDRNRSWYDRFDRDGDGVADLLDEALWGAEFLEKCLYPDSLRIVGTISTGYRYWGKPEDETDNQPGTGDERPVRDPFGSTAHLVSGFALLGMHAPQGERYVQLAERLYEKHGGSVLDLIALARATHHGKYKQQLNEIVQQFLAADDKGLSHFRELAEFALAFPEDERVPRITALTDQKLVQLTETCDPYFGITRSRDRDGSWIYFMHYQKINDWYVGGSMGHLDAAYEGLLLARLGESRGRAIAENQLHWIWGRNPFNTSLMEGVGKRFIPFYHHRYNTLPGNPRGAVPGAVVNGITRTVPWLDRPWLDLFPVPTGEYQCNEPWLPHNNRMLFALSVW